MIAVRRRAAYNGAMVLQTVEGIYENGAVRLTGDAPEVERAPVLVTFLNGTPEADLKNAGISPAQAANLRLRLGTFAEDWDRPEMDAYDAL